jgi:peptidoglycan L-alanyl-D-glutamate endopeptidase CwlK
MTSRRIEDLQPLLQVKARYWLEMCEQEWPGKEVDPLITNTLRTHADQAKLYAQGRTTPGKIVTWAKPGSSAHNYGLAWDFVPLRIGKPVWTTRAAADLRLWTRMGEIAESLGLEWGGRWQKVDMPHIQIREWRRFVQ